MQGREGEGEEDQVPRGGGRQVLFMVRERKRYSFRGRVNKVTCIQHVIEIPTLNQPVREKYQP